MLNRKEYNSAFKTNLSEEQFEEINRNPIPIDEVSGVRYELHEIQSILSYYIKEKLKEKEENKND